MLIDGAPQQIRLSPQRHRPARSTQSTNGHGTVERPARLQVWRTGLAPCDSQTIRYVRLEWTGHCGGRFDLPPHKGRAAPSQRRCHDACNSSRARLYGFMSIVGRQTSFDDPGRSSRFPHSGRSRNFLQPSPNTFDPFRPNAQRANSGSNSCRSCEPGASPRASRNVPAGASLRLNKIAAMQRTSWP